MNNCYVDSTIQYYILYYTIDSTILNFQKIVGMAVMQYDNTGLYNEVCMYLSIFHNYKNYI